MNDDHMKGAVNEHRAAAHFLSKGKQVYWPACQQGVTDFVVEDEAGFHRVQVKTATWNRAAGPNHYLQCRTRLGSTKKYADPRPGDLYDIFFVVSNDTAWIIPAKEITSSNISLQVREPDGSVRDQLWSQYKTPL